MKSVKQQKTHIIWDLSGTLFRPSSAGFSQQELEDLSLLFYMWSGKKEHSKLETYALELLNRAHEPVPSCEVLRLHTGDTVPAIICLWLSGLISSQEVYQKTMSAAGLVPIGTLTASEVKQAHAMIKVYFEPNTLARCMRPIGVSTKLVALCAENPHNILYILSNWDKESFVPFFEKNKNSEPLSYIKKENIFISAQTGYVKPQPEIYDFFVSLYQLEPSTCFFIDDQEENIAAAQTFGIDGLHFNSHNATELVQKLQSLSVIRQK